MSRATDESTRAAALARGRADDDECRQRAAGGRLVRQDLERETVVPGTIASGTATTQDKVKS